MSDLISMSSIPLGVTNSSSSSASGSISPSTSVSGSRDSGITARRVRRIVLKESYRHTLKAAGATGAQSRRFTRKTMHVLEVLSPGCCTIKTEPGRADVCGNWWRCRQCRRPGLERCQPYIPVGSEMIAFTFNDCSPGGGTMMLSGLGEVRGDESSRGASVTGTVVSEETCHCLSASGLNVVTFEAYPALEALGGMYHRNSLLALRLADVVRYVSLQH